MARWYLIAGEASGDLHGSNLMRGLYEADPHAEIRFWGGGLMSAVGGELVQDYRDGAVMGFTQVVLHPGKFAKRLESCKKDILAWEPDAVVLIDYPGFNFKIAEFAHKAGFKVFYYIAPKVWASRESRVKKLKEYVDKLFIVFPFEIPYFTSKGVDFVYKGNPLVDAVDASPAISESREDFLARTGLQDRPVIALLPGSRAGEISSMMPVYMAFADKLRSLPDYSDHQFVIAGAPSRTMEDYSGFIGDRDYVKVVFGESLAIMRHGEAAVVNSGTASLECALIGTPQVVAYRTTAINSLLARMIIKVKYISLGNLIMDRSCFRELLQDYFTPDNLLYEVRRLIEDSDYRSAMLSDYAAIRESLGGSGASAEVAKAMVMEFGNS